MRVASLVPAGTLCLEALGVEPVGVSHSCPNPRAPPGGFDLPLTGRG